MTIGDLTFDLFTNTSLTAAYTGLSQLEHKTDQTDNPQDITLYFGSLGSAGGDTEDRELNAFSNPGVDDIVITPVDRLEDWEASTSYSLGQLIEPTTPNTYKYRCTTAGTSDSSEPSWPTSGIGSTVVDNDVVWTLVGKRHEITEITLALSEAELDTNTPGDPLTLATTITSGTSNKIALWIRIINAVTTVNSNTGYPEIGLSINAVREDDV